MITELLLLQLLWHDFHIILCISFLLALGHVLDQKVVYVNTLIAEDRKEQIGQLVSRLGGLCVFVHMHLYKVLFMYSPCAILYIQAQ